MILAHVERYSSYQKNKDIWEEILDLPLTIQLNAGEILQFGKKKLCRELLNSGIPVLLGSDCHNTGRRAPNMLKGKKSSGEAGRGRKIRRDRSIGRAGIKHMKRQKTTGIIVLLAVLVLRQADFGVRTSHGLLCIAGIFGIFNRRTENYQYDASGSGIFCEYGMYSDSHDFRMPQCDHVQSLYFCPWLSIIIWI